MLPTEFTPKLFTLLQQGLNRRQLARDALAGLIVGVIALPLAIAFAIASGVSPEKGLITAVVAGFVISFFGGSRVQIGGPTGAFIVIVYGIVQEYGVEGLTIATLIAGFLIMGLGILRMGRLLKYIPYPLIVGFTSGIAIIIFSSQIKDLLGLSMGPVPADFVSKWREFFGAIGTINPWAAGIAAATILIAALFPKISTRVPGSLLAILLCTAAVYMFELPVETIESRFGEIPSRLPAPRMYLPDFETIQQLLQPAIAIALLGSIESLLSAVVADGMIGSNHRSNMELVAQGGANVLSALFGGIPATGAIARTAANIRNGGRTPVAGIVHALTLLIIMLALAPLAKLVPLACLAGILVVVSYNMAEWPSFIAILKSHKYDVLILLNTFFLTVFFDLVLAIEIGLVFAAFLFMKRMADLSRVEAIDSETDGKEILFDEELGEVPEGVMLYEVNGPLFFGASQKFRDTLQDINQHPRVLIIRMRHVPLVDATGVQRLREVVHYFRASGTQVVLSGVNTGVRAELQKAAVLEEQYIKPSISEALQTARELVAQRLG